MTDCPMCGHSEAIIDAEALALVCTGCGYRAEACTRCGAFGSPHYCPDKLIAPIDADRYQAELERHNARIRSGTHYALWGALILGAIWLGASTYVLLHYGPRWGGP